MAAHLGTMAADFELPGYSTIFLTYVGQAPPPISEERMALNLAPLICQREQSQLWELIQWDQELGEYKRLKGTYLYVKFEFARKGLREYLWPPAKKKR